MNIYNYLIKNSLNYPKKSALIYNDEQLSYLELLQLVDIYSEKFFKNYRLKPNSRITVLMENSFEYILIILIACKLNLTVQTLGTYYSNNLIYSRIKKFNPKVIFTKKYLDHFFNKYKNKVKFFEYNKSLIYADYKKKNYSKTKFNNKLLAVESSGTTGSSKTVIFSEKCKINRSISAKETYKLTSKDILITTAPFDHSVGHRQIFLPLILGATNVILKNFHPKLWFKTIKKFKVSFTLLISTQISKILDTISLNNNNTKYLKNIVSVSTKLNLKDKKKLLKLNSTIHEMYGTCEIGTATNINLKKYKNKSDSVGKATKNYKIKIIQNNKICNTNKIGEIVCYSPNSFEEYYNYSGKKDKIFFKHYFKTGDLGYLDDDNYLYYVGRKKNLVKINGLSVYPEEIEKKIKKNFSYNNFVITGTKNLLGGEKLIMFVENFSKLNLSKLNKFLNSKLEKFEIPEKIINLKKFPKTNLGKINLSEIKKYEI